MTDEEFSVRDLIFADCHMHWRVAVEQRVLVGLVLENAHKDMRVSRLDRLKDKGSAKRVDSIDISAVIKQKTQNRLILGKNSHFNWSPIIINEKETLPTSFGLAP